MRLDSMESLSSSLIQCNIMSSPSSTKTNENHNVPDDSNSLESRNEQSESKSVCSLNSNIDSINHSHQKMSPSTDEMKIQIEMQTHSIPSDESTENLSSLQPQFIHREKEEKNSPNHDRSTIESVNDIATTPSLESASSFHTSNSTISTSALTTKLHYENMMRQQQKQHEDQIDEIIDSLNALETTYSKEIANLKDQLSKKEVMTEALANQNMTLKNDFNVLEHNFSLLNQKYNRALTDLEVSTQKCTEILDEKKELEQHSKVELIEAVQKAQDEIRSAAESQFASANQTYVKLKQDYTILLKEKESMSVELTTFEKRMTLKDREMETITSKYVAELAEVRASMATAQADAIKMEQKYKTKIRVLEDDNHEKKVQMDQQEKILDDLKHRLELVIVEKEDLVKENKELQSLCEELMAIVEGNASSHN